MRNGWWILVFLLVLASLLMAAFWLSSRDRVEHALMLQAGLILFATAVCQALRREPMSAVVGRLDGRWIVELLVGALIGACIMLLPALVLALLGRVAWQRNPAGIASLGLGALPLLGAALGEELLFRGFIFQRLLAGLGVWPAQLITAGFFLLTHLGNTGMTGGTALRGGANIFLASLLLGMALIRTRSLALPIGIHFMANFVQGCVLGFGVSGETQPRWLIPVSSGPEWLTGGEFGLEGSLPGLVAVAAATFLFYRWRERSDPGFPPKKVHSDGRLPASPTDDG